MFKWIFMLVFCTGLLVFSSSSETFLLDGVEGYYKQGDFSQARLLYDQYLNEGGMMNAVSYYNLGNVYFRLNQLGHSIVQYRRGLRLSPRNPDLVYNLSVVKTHILDQEDASQGPLFSFSSLFSFLSVREVFVIFLFIFTVFNGLFFLFCKGWRQDRFKQIFYVFLALFLFSSFFLIGTYHVQYSDNQAVIVVPKVAVKSGPSDFLSTLFFIHDGASVQLLHQKQDWVLLLFHNGLKGWVKRSAMEVI